MLRAPLAVLVVSAVLVGVTALPARAAEQPLILINELANGGPDSDSDSFFELRNWGTTTVDLTGWRVYRCSLQGLRSNVGRPEGDLTGITLAPGEILTVSKIGMPGELHVTQPFAPQGFGLYLEAPDARLADAVGVYSNEPWPTESECTVGGRNLPNSLAFALGESWQRVGTGPHDFVRAPSTITEQNATVATETEPTTVVISELASSGPAGSGDEFIELANTGTEPQDLSGWTIYRCTGGGRLTAETLQVTVQGGTVLEPGERWVAGGPSFDGTPDARYDKPISDTTSGVLVVSATGNPVDRLSISSEKDTACQTGDTKVPAVMDAVAGESYQRVGSQFIVAARTPGAPNATVASSVLAEKFEYADPLAIAISEVATDPSTEGMPAGSVQRNYIELANYGSASVDIGGYTVRRCEANGMRSVTPQFTVPTGTRLASGAVYLAAREGTAAASDADITYAESLNFLGTGVWVDDARGERIDSVGIYAANEMDSSNVIGSPCSKGLALTTYLPDRMLGETFQRSQFTGDDSSDFLAADATPGTLDLLDFPDATARVATITTAALPIASRLHDARRLSADVPVVPLEAWSGTSAQPLATLRGENERALDAQAPAPAADDSFGFPYQRFELDAAALTEGSVIEWTGTTVTRGEVQLSVWAGNAWRMLGVGDSTIAGQLEAGDVGDGRVSLLVQDGPRTESTLADTSDGTLENPADYDFAVTHITDTQYLSESYPEVYAQLVSWIADNASDRKIAFATHTGDLIQNWVDPDQNDIRARVEFERASAIQAILDDAGVPNSVLPGNHDNKRGVTDELFNEYFPPSRYEGTDWYGGSIAPGDNSANFSTFENNGAKFLMLSLPYAYGEREIVWAEGIVTSHPDYNIIVSTHEHVMPKTLEESAHRSANSRWISKGQELWDRVIAPNRNVVIVLSGHFHGIGQLVTENAGGIEGHTVVELLADYQEFRTHTGERATGFFRMLQFDVDAGVVAVDTRSVRLAESYSFDYDYRQFLPDNGSTSTPSNARPWRIVESGLQGRYDAEDDEFGAQVQLQHPKLVNTLSIEVGAP
ncbi:hypothetical protein BH10ACT7_BH10ACT7_10810 [soil metagenome]